MTIRYFHKKTLVDANAAVAAINLAAGYPRRGVVVGGADSLAASHSAGAAGWQDSAVSTPLSMSYQLANFGYLMGVDDAVEPHLAGAGVPHSFTDCVLISGQSNASYVEHPDMSAQDVMWAKFAANGTGISAWATSTYTGYYPLTIKASARMDVKAFVWIHGETDALNGEHALYEGRLTTFLAAVRASYGKPTLPAIVCIVNGSGSGANLAAIRTAQNNVCVADPYTHAFDMNAYTLSGDLLHYPAPTNIQIGLDLAAALVPLL